jgi:class 3 adenylate cyclase
MVAAAWMTCALDIDGVPRQINYSIQGGTLEAAAADIGNAAIDFFIRSHSAGSLCVVLPTGLIESKSHSASQSDERSGDLLPFIVTVDDKQAVFEEMKPENDSRMLLIEFRAGSERIRVQGTAIKTLLLNTDKASYSRGEIISVTGKVGTLKTEFHLRANAELGLSVKDRSEVSIQVIDPNSKPVRFEKVAANRDRTFSYQFKMDDELATAGTYTIVARHADMSAEKKFLFSPDTTGDLIINIPSEAHANPSGHLSEPKAYNIALGARVTWLNHDTEVHNATSGDPDTGEPDGVFDTGFIPPGKSATITVDSGPGLLRYYCRFHWWERGALNISSASGSNLPQVENESHDAGGVAASPSGLATRTTRLTTADRRLNRSIRSDRKEGRDTLQRITKMNNFIENTKMMAALQRHFDKNMLDGFLEPELNTIQNKKLTVVFWDIKGFSYVCEVLQVYPKLIIDFLQEYFSIATEVIFRNGGVLDKFIGDGVMALFGYRSKDETGVEAANAAIQAALQFKEEFEQLAEKWTTLWEQNVPQKLTIGLKCGVNTGYCLVGKIGDEARFQFTALGSTVNISSRLIDSRINDRKIIVSSTTKALVESRFRLQKLGVISDMRNIPGNFEYFEVLGTKRR